MGIDLSGQRLTFDLVKVNMFDQVKVNLVDQSWPAQWASQIWPKGQKGPALAREGQNQPMLALKKAKVG